MRRHTSWHVNKSSCLITPICLFPFRCPSVSSNWTSLGCHRVMRHTHDGRKHELALNPLIIGPSRKESLRFHCDSWVSTARDRVVMDEIISWGVAPRQLRLRGLVQRYPKAGMQRWKDQSVFAWPFAGLEGCSPHPWHCQ